VVDDEGRLERSLSKWIGKHQEKWVLGSSECFKVELEL
jgi:hypothetical protein